MGGLFYVLTRRPAVIDFFSNTLYIMAINKLEIEKFYQQGFLPVENVLTPVEVKTLKTRLMNIGNKVVEFPEKYIQIEPRITSGEMDEDPIGINNVRKISHLTKYDPIFKEYARHPKIIDIVTTLLGPDLKIYLDQTLCKPPFSIG